MDYDKVELNRRMIKYFNVSELKDVYFNLDLDREDIVNEVATKSDMSRELITYLNRHNRMRDLVNCLQEMRNDIEWNLHITPHQKSKSFANNIGVNPDISNSLLDRYMSVWEVLIDLKNAGDALWERASRENILNFANLLLKARPLVEMNAVIFDQREKQKLLEILKMFGQFRAGKTRLAELRHDPQMFEEFERYGVSNSNPHQIKEQIHQNQRIKLEYEYILEDIEHSFRASINRAVRR